MGISLVWCLAEILSQDHLLDKYHASRLPRTYATEAQRAIAAIENRKKLYPLQFPQRSC